ncbi:MAG TPA: hypothetical protein VF071_03145 [Candidatus Limnocylindria bacterium]
MSAFARWFAVLGVLASLPAAGLLGAGVGELLRTPDGGIGLLLEREGPVIGFAVMAVFLFRTASGLRDERTWALHVGIGLAALLAVGGLAMLVGGGWLLGSIGAAPQLAPATTPLTLGAVLLGTRLLVGLWSTSPYALPFDRADLRALGTLAGVLVLAALGHALATGLPS